MAKNRKFSKFLKLFKVQANGMNQLISLISEKNFKFSLVLNISKERKNPRL